MMYVHTIVLLIAGIETRYGRNRILHSIGQLNIGSYPGVYANPFVFHTSLYLVFPLQLVVTLVPASEKFHSIDI